MSDEREELARILHDEASWYGLDVRGYGEHLKRAADAILAAGYRQVEASK